MKRSILFLILSFSHFLISVHAQYNEVKVSRAEKNRAFTEIVALEENLSTDVPSYGGGRGRLFNFDWRFQLGNPEGAESKEFNDSEWRVLDLPHDFQFEQPWEEEAGGARGWKNRCEGWYRKTFTAPEE